MSEPPERGVGADPDTAAELGAALTRAELRRLRRGELDAAAVTRWMERTRGLAAPDAGDHVDLVANGCGWVLGLGGPARRRQPRFWRAFDRCGVVIALGPVWAQYLGVNSMAGVLALGVAPFAGAAVVAYLVARGRIERQRAAAQRPSRLGEVPAGTLVTVTGVVAPQPTVPSLFGGVPAVLFRNRVGPADETRGLDFLVHHSGGEEVRIRVRGALFLDRPRPIRRPPACGPVSYGFGDGQMRLRSDAMTGTRLWRRPLARRESSIGPGDSVEVCGFLHRLPARDGAASFDRQIPIELVLQGGHLPLLVRRAPRT